MKIYKLLFFLFVALPSLLQAQIMPIPPYVFQREATFKKLEETFKEGVIVQNMAYFSKEDKGILYVFQTATRINNREKLETYEFKAKVPIGLDTPLSADYLNMDLTKFLYRGAFKYDGYFYTYLPDQQKWTAGSTVKISVDDRYLIFGDHDRIRAELSKPEETTKALPSTPTNPDIKLQRLTQLAQSSQGLHLKADPFINDLFEYDFKVDKNGLISELVKSRDGKVVQIVQNRKAPSFDFVMIQKKIETNCLHPGSRMASTNFAGFYIERQKDRRVLITRLLENFPAEQMGLKQGDEVLSLNGVKVSGTKKEIVYDACIGTNDIVIEFKREDKIQTLTVPKKKYYWGYRGEVPQLPPMTVGYF